jgi:ElaB/YqjD/DUF883 family membrane-anchored ribosome-binding protein
MKNTTVTRDELLNEFNAVVDDTEKLLKSIASAGGEKAAAVRAEVEQNLKAAKDKLQALEKTAEEKALRAAHATDEYVHARPWQSIAVVAAIAAVVGLVLGLLLNRRS